MSCSLTLRRHFHYGHHLMPNLSEVNASKTPIYDRFLQELIELEGHHIAHVSVPTFAESFLLTHESPTLADFDRAYEQYRKGYDSQCAEMAESHPVLKDYLSAKQLTDTDKNELQAEIEAQLGCPLV